MNIHHYNSSTKVYKRTTTAISGHNTPASATTVALPTIPSGHEAVFNESTGAWTTRPIETLPASSENPLTDFQNMTIAQRLAHYGLGDLVDHIAGQTVLAKTATVDAQIASIQSTLTSLQTDVTAMGTTNATVTQNQQLIQELVEDFERLNSTLLLEENH